MKVESVILLYTSPHSILTWNGRFCTHGSFEQVISQNKVGPLSKAHSVGFRPSHWMPSYFLAPMTLGLHGFSRWVIPINEKYIFMNNLQILCQIQWDSNRDDGIRLNLLCHPFTAIQTNLIFSVTDQQTHEIVCF